MKLRMLSVLSIVIALLIKSVEISAQDYHYLRVLAHAVPAESPTFLPYPMETQLDSAIYQLAQTNVVMERFVGINDSITPEFEAYEKLKMLASEQELNDLLLHASPVVKVYAHRALVVNEMNMNCDYELALFEDTTCIDWFADDLLTNTTVAEMVQQEYFE